MKFEIIYNDEKTCGAHDYCEAESLEEAASMAQGWLGNYNYATVENVEDSSRFAIVCHDGIEYQQE